MKVNLQHLPVKYRLLILMTAGWLLFCYIGDGYYFGELFWEFGVFPSLLLWGIIWIIRGVVYNRNIKKLGENIK